MHPLLRRLLVVLGVGGLLALLLQLRRRLQKPPPLLEQTPPPNALPRHAAATPPARPPPRNSADPPPTPVPTAERAAASGLYALPQRRSPSPQRKRPPAPLPTVAASPAGQRKFGAFVSHMKAEASMEARFLKGALEEQLGKRVFLDSDDLRDLGDLLDHVRDSEAVVLVQSQSVLTRPWCLLELAAAMDAGVPVVGVSLQNHAFPYEFEEARDFLTHLDATLAIANPEARNSPQYSAQSAPLSDGTRARLLSQAAELLLDHGVDLTDAAHKLSSRLPKIISVPFDNTASHSVLQATMGDLAAAVRAARPVPLADRAEWEAQRRRRPRALWERAMQRAGSRKGSRRGSADDPPFGVVVGGGDDAAAAAALLRRRRPCPTLADPLPCAELREKRELPPYEPRASPRPAVIVVNGGVRLSADCELEACCSFTAPVLALLAELNVPYVALTIDLQEKPLWLGEMLGADPPQKLTTPACRMPDGRWLTDSADILAAMPASLSAESDAYRRGFWDPPPLLADGALARAVGLPAMMPLLTEKWAAPDDHPALRAWAPFEEALATSETLGGEGDDAALCAVDLQAGAWCHTVRALDFLMSAAPLDWEGRLPRVSRWLDVHIMPRLEKVTAVERRYQLLMTQVLTAKMPALAARIPDDIRKDIEATVEAARASSAEAFPI